MELSYSQSSAGEVPSEDWEALTRHGGHDKAGRLCCGVGRAVDAREFFDRARGGGASNWVGSPLESGVPWAISGGSSAAMADGEPGIQRRGSIGRRGERSQAQLDRDVAEGAEKGPQEETPSWLRRGVVTAARSCCTCGAKSSRQGW